MGFPNCNQIKTFKSRHLKLLYVYYFIVKAYFRVKFSNRVIRIIGQINKHLKTLLLFSYICINELI